MRTRYDRDIYLFLSLYRFFAYGLAVVLIQVVDTGATGLGFQTYLLLTTMGAYTLVKVMGPLRWWQTDPMTYVVLGGDLLVGLLALLLTGGLTSGFLLYSFLPVITAALLFEERLALLTAGISSLTVTLAHLVLSRWTDTFAWIMEGNVLLWAVGGGIQEAKHLIGQTAELVFKERICEDFDALPAGLTEAEWAAVRCDVEFMKEEKALEDLGGRNLVDAYAGTHSTTGRPIVNIVFDDEGADAFFEVTDRISRTGDLLAIYLDGEELVAPAAEQGIAGGRAFISGGDFTAERVRTVAIQLRSGALPVSLELVQERNVDATLGADSLQKTVIAGIIGLGLVLAFMIIYYKVPGAVAATALIMFAVLLLAVFKIVPVTLTLAGGAALILSLGVAVDANILIAERTKEELRAGRSLFAAIAEGFDRAWPSIRDSNISTLIICVVLFWFGQRFTTSIMQGFALTLGIGVVLSMFTAFFASRVFMRSLARTPLGQRLSLFVPVGEARAQRTPGG